MTPPCIASRAGLGIDTLKQALLAVRESHPTFRVLVFRHDCVVLCEKKATEN